MVEQKIQWAAGLVVLGLLCLAPCAPGDDGRTLEGLADVEGLPEFQLTPEQSWDVPDSVLVVDAKLLGGRAAVVRSLDGRVLAFLPEMDLPIHVSTDSTSRLVSGTMEGGHRSFLVSRSRGTITALAPDGSLSPQSALCPEIEALEVGALDGGRLTGLVSSPERGPLLRVWLLDGTSCTLQSEHAVPPDSQGASLWARRSGSVVLALADAMAPLHEVSLNGETAPRQVSESIPEDLRPGQPRALVRLRSLPLLATDRGFIRVLADLVGDGRRFEFWSDSLAHLRTSKLDLPLGLSASIPDERLALSLHGHRSKVLTVLRWDWVD